jgi:GNAT superfamily N-acetyltransferase
VIGFRRAVASDAEAIAALHVASWRETYADLLPAHVLSALSVESRAAMWRGVLENPDAFGATTVFVAESRGDMVGFAWCGAQRDDGLKERGFGGEFGAIYVLGAQQGAGIGRTLMRMMARTLLDQGYSAASLWVLRENLPARAFYEKLGGAAVAEKVEEQAGVAMAERAYGWSDLPSLLG